MPAHHFLRRRGCAEVTGKSRDSDVGRGRVVDRLVTPASVRPLIMTRAPSLARLVAIARPIPAVLPVTRASLPLRWRSMSVPSGKDHVGKRCDLNVALLRWPRSPITLTANGFSTRTAYRREADVTCCVGSSIVIGVPPSRNGRPGRHHLTLTVRRHASKVRSCAFPMSAMPAY